MEVKPGYKRTEVGVIPEDWGVKALGELAHIQRGSSPRPISSSAWYDPASEVGWVRISDVANSDGKYLRQTRDYFSDKGIARSRYLPSGSLIMSICATVGVPVITLMNACIHDGFVGLTNLRHIDQGFLYYKLKELEPAFKTMGQTGSQNNLNTTLVREHFIALPPLPEQRAIAAVLSDVDALITALDRLIAKKRAIKQGAMQQLLTGKTRLPGFSGEWAKKTLGEIAELKSGYAFRSSTYVDTGDFKIITIANVQDGYLDVKECKRISAIPSDLQPHQELRQGDCLISMTGNVGRVCCVDEDKCLLNQRVGKLIPTSANHAFFFQLIRQRQFIDSMMLKAKGGAQGNLSVSDIMEFEFCAPIAEEEQRAIAGVLSDMDAEIAALEARRDKTRALKQGMMQELLTGRTRLMDN